MTLDALLTGSADIDDDPESECSWCGGDGWEVCDDPIQCLNDHIGDPFAGGEHPCGACGGSGLAKDQTVW